MLFFDYLIIFLGHYMVIELLLLKYNSLKIHGHFAALTILFLLLMTHNNNNI